METEDEQENQGRLGLRVLDQNVMGEMRVDQPGPSIRIEGK